MMCIEYVFLEKSPEDVETFSYILKFSQIPIEARNVVYILAFSGLLVFIAAIFALASYTRLDRIALGISATTGVISTVLLPGFIIFSYGSEYLYKEVLILGLAKLSLGLRYGHIVPIIATVIIGSRIKFSH